MGTSSDDDAAERSNGYDAAARDFVERRTHTKIGADTVRRWSESLPTRAAILDLGCGDGVPISQTLVNAGFELWGIDASPEMVRRFRENLPRCPVACEAIEDSAFFGRAFGGVVAWGLIFLLPAETQEALIEKNARSLVAGGRLLFTAPAQRCEWLDVLTGRPSQSLGRDRYVELLSVNGLALVEELEDEGDNHYYHAVRG